MTLLRDNANLAKRLERRRGAGGGEEQAEVNGIDPDANSWGIQSIPTGGLCKREGQNLASVFHPIFVSFSIL